MAWMPQDGQNVRIYSKLQPNLVLAAAPGDQHPVYVHQLANGDSPETTVFQVQTWGGTDYLFELYLRNVPDQGDMKLSWQTVGNTLWLVLNPAFQDSGIADCFAADPLNPEPWVALNDYGQNFVVDVFNSESDEGSRVDAFPWNGGDNQWWRIMSV